MNWNKMSLLKKIAGTIMAITVVSTVALSYIQYRLYTNNFETIFSNLEDSVMTMKRDSARDILREVKIATEGSLARGEYDVFTNFAKKQKEIGEIQAFSFYGKTGKIELSSDAGRINEAIASELWNQAEKTNEMFLKRADGRLLVLLSAARGRRHAASAPDVESRRTIRRAVPRILQEQGQRDVRGRAQQLYFGLVASQLRRDLRRGRGVVHRFRIGAVDLPRDSSPAPRLHGRRQGADRRGLQRRGEDRRQRRSRANDPRHQRHGRIDADQGQPHARSLGPCGQERLLRTGSSRGEGRPRSSRRGHEERSSTTNRRRSNVRPTSPKTTENKPPNSAARSMDSSTSSGRRPKATSPGKSESKGTNPSTSWPRASARC